MIVKYLFLFLYFIIANIVLFLVPGEFLLNLAGVQHSGDKKFLLNEVLGLVFFTLVIFLLKLLHLSPYFYLLLSFFAFVKTKKIKLNIPLFCKEKLTVLLLITGTLSQNLSLLLSALKDKSKDLIFLSDWAFHDFSWHLALIEELKKQVPPLNPVFKAQPLKDYHYFYNLLVAGFHQITKISALDLLYRFFPLLISFLLGLSIYLFVKDLTKNKIPAQVCLFLTYFCGSFGWLIPFFKGKNIEWGESNFWVSQTFSMAIQPHFIISIVIIFSALILLNLWLKNKKIGLIIIISILLGTIMGFKAYSLPVIAAGLIVFGAHELFIKRNKKIIYLILGVFLLSLFLFLLTTSGQASFFWAPFWFPKAMVASSDRFEMIDLILKEQYYLANKNLLHFTAVKLLQLFIFILGNLGIRVFAFLGLIICWKKQEKKEILLFLFGSFIFAFSFPLFFLQTGAVWNSIQFWYYFLIFANIFTAEFFSKLLEKKSQIFQYVIVLVILALSLPTTIKTFYGLNFKAPRVVVTSKQKEALGKLRTLSKPKELVLLYPSFRNSDSSLVSAFSGRRTFFAHQGQADLFGIDFRQEKEDIGQIFRSQDELLIKSFFVDNKIDYLFLWANEAVKPTPEFRKNINLIFENEAAKIYKVSAKGL